MATSKRKRKYSQDFSGMSLTDQSFAPSCDVNAIVRHYETTGVDPHAHRIAQARYGEATTLTYEDAMRNAAELASFQAENPDWQESASEDAQATISEEALSPAEQEALASGASGAAKLAPQDASGGDS